MDGSHNIAMNESNDNNSNNVMAAAELDEPVQHADPSLPSSRDPVLSPIAPTLQSLSATIYLMAERVEEMHKVIQFLGPQMQHIQEIHGQLRQEQLRLATKTDGMQQQEGNITVRQDVQPAEIHLQPTKVNPSSSDNSTAIHDRTKHMEAESNMEPDSELLPLRNDTATRDTHESSGKNVATSQRRISSTASNKTTANSGIEDNYEITNKIIQVHEMAGSEANEEGERNIGNDSHHSSRQQSNAAAQSKISHEAANAPRSAAKQAPEKSPKSTVKDTAGASLNRATESAHRHATTADDSLKSKKNEQKRIAPIAYANISRDDDGDDQSVYTLPSLLPKDLEIDSSALSIVPLTEGLSGSSGLVSEHVLARKGASGSLFYRIAAGSNSNKTENNSGAFDRPARLQSISSGRALTLHDSFQKSSDHGTVSNSVPNSASTPSGGNADVSIALGSGIVSGDADTYGAIAAKDRNGSESIRGDQSTASWSFGEEVIDVVEQVLKDPYGFVGRYTGSILKSTAFPHGSGTMAYLDLGNPKMYKGGWRHGQWHGKGRVEFLNSGDFYEGDFQCDQRHGRGCYARSDGRSYEGSFRNDKRHGKGVLIWPDGSNYRGDFVDGLRDGHGIYEFASNGGRYEGSWKNGRYHGHGVCTFADQSFYNGEWVEGKAHGTGVAYFADGSVRHNGQWKNHEPVMDSSTSVATNTTHTTSNKNLISRSR